VRRKIADLTALRHELERIINQCDHGTVAQCRIIEALVPKPASKRAGKGAHRRDGP
jgi:hypothetical protein